jgi:hypothetical protein
MFFGCKKRNPDLHFLFLSTVTVNEPPPRSPKGPYGETYPFKERFFKNSKLPHKKFPCIKNLFPYFNCPIKGPSPHVTQNGASIERDVQSRVIISISFGVPVKEPSLLVPLIQLHRKELPYP